MRDTNVQHDVLLTMYTSWKTNLERSSVLTKHNAYNNTQHSQERNYMFCAALVTRNWTSTRFTCKWNIHTFLVKNNSTCNVKTVRPQLMLMKPVKCCYTAPTVKYDAILLKHKWSLYLPAAVVKQNRSFGFDHPILLRAVTFNWYHVSGSKFLSK